MKVKRVWVAQWATMGELAQFNFRFDLAEGYLPSVMTSTFPTSRTDSTPQRHLSFGLFDKDELLAIQDAIQKFITENE